MSQENWQDDVLLTQLKYIKNQWVEDKREHQEQMRQVKAKAEDTQAQLNRRIRNLEAQLEQHQLDSSIQHKAYLATIKSLQLELDGRGNRNLDQKKKEEAEQVSSLRALLYLSSVSQQSRSSTPVLQFSKRVSVPVTVLVSLLANARLLQKQVDILRAQVVCLQQTMSDTVQWLHDHLSRILLHSFRSPK